MRIGGLDRSAAPVTASTLITAERRSRSRRATPRRSCRADTDPTAGNLKVSIVRRGFASAAGGEFVPERSQSAADRRDRAHRI